MKNKINLKDLINVEEMDKHKTYFVYVDTGNIAKEQVVRYLERIKDLLNDNGFYDILLIPKNAIEMRHIPDEKIDKLIEHLKNIKQGQTLNYSIFFPEDEGGTL